MRPQPAREDYPLLVFHFALFGAVIAAAVGFLVELAQIIRNSPL